MNRRNFFGTVGAVIAGAVLGRNVPPVADGEVLFATGKMQTLGGRLRLDDSNGMRLFTTLKVDAGDGLTIPFEPITRLDGKPLKPGDLYFDADGVLQLRPDGEELVVDSSWYDAWL